MLNLFIKNKGFFLFFFLTETFVRCPVNSNNLNVSVQVYTSVPRPSISLTCSTFQQDVLRMTTVVSCVEAAVSPSCISAIHSIHRYILFGLKGPVCVPAREINRSLEVKSVTDRISGHHVKTGAADGATVIKEQTFAAVLEIDSPPVHESEAVIVRVARHTCQEHVLVVTTSWVIHTNRAEVPVGSAALHLVNLDG